MSARFVSVDTGDHLLPADVDAANLQPIRDGKIDRVVLDVRRFGAVGDGITDDADAINAALAEARHLTDGHDNVWVDVFLPGGVYRTEAGLVLLDPEDTTISRVTVRGDGRNATVIKPVGEVQGFHSLSATPLSPDLPDYYRFVDLAFQDFTMDCRGQSTVDSSTRKAWQGLGWLNCRWSRLHIVGTPGSSVGTDYMVGCAFEDVTVVNSGRGINTPSGYDEAVEFAVSRSGFGIGVGLYPNESITFVNCHTRDCFSSGFFFETYHMTWPKLRSGQITLVGCTARYNRVGVADIGGVVRATGCQFDDNEFGGWYSGVNRVVRTEPGVDGGLVNCSVRRNGGPGITFGSRHQHGSDITQDPYPDAPAGGGYRIQGCQIEGNNGPGIAADVWVPGDGGLSIIANTFKRNKWGVRLTNGLAPLRDLIVAHNIFDGNDHVGLGLLVAMNGPQITGNRYINSDGDNVQTVGAMFHPAEIVTSPVVTGNVYRQIDVEMANADHLDTTHIAGNVTLAPEDDPDTNTVLYAEDLDGDGETTAESLGDGWTVQNLQDTESQWRREELGATTAGGSGQDNVNYRDFGMSNLYVEARFGEVDTHVASVLGPIINDVGASPRFGVLAGPGAYPQGQEHYAMYLMQLTGASAQPSLLWESDVPSTEGHTVALSRPEGSTVTTMWIDGVAVHTVDVPEVPAVTTAGLYARHVNAGQRHVRSVRVLEMPEVQ